MGVRVTQPALSVSGTKSLGVNMSLLILPPRIVIFIFLLFAQHSLQAEECAGPEVVHSTAYSSHYPASNVLILGEEDAYLDNTKTNYWLAEFQKTTGQGFTMRLDACARSVAGIQIKNIGKGLNSHFATKAFKISGSMNENGPWETLVEDQLDDTRGIAASLFNFTFEKPVEIQFIKFDLISYWGAGGALQYFAAILATSGPTAESTTDSTIETTIDEVTNADEKPIWFYFLISIPVAFTIFGLGYMIRTNCKIRQKCCKRRVNLEKEDENLDYGTYYYADGERRQDVMEVEDSNPAYESANAQSNLGNQATDRNPKDDENPQSNSAGQLDDY